MLQHSSSEERNARDYLGMTIMHLYMQQMGDFDWQITPPLLKLLLSCEDIDLNITNPQGQRAIDLIDKKSIIFSTLDKEMKKRNTG